MGDPSRSVGDSPPADLGIATAELGRLAPRAPDYAAESRALADLAQELAARPATVLNTLAETARQLCRADSAGVSALEGDRLRWRAVAGTYAPKAGADFPAGETTCGTAIARGGPQLFRDPARHFPLFHELDPPPVEDLVVPFQAEGGPAGTLWVVAHSPGRRFDAEDARLLGSLAGYAAAAVRAVGTLQEVRRAKADAEAARTQLRDTEGRLRLMVESATDYAILSTDEAGRVATWSSGAEKVFGWPENEILGQDAAVLFTPEDRLEAVPEQEMARALESGRAEDERWHLRKDGRRFYASGVMTPLRDGGRLCGFTKVARDATDRKRNEDRTRFLAGLAEQARGASDAEAAMGAVVDALGAHFAAARCVYAEVDPAAGTTTALREYAAGWPGVAGTYRSADFGEAVFRDLAAGRTVAVDDVADDPRTRDRAAAYAALGVRAFVSVPLVKGGALAANLSVAADRPRKWEPADAELVQEVAERVWSAVETARALDRLGASEGRLQLAIEIAQMGTFETDLATGAMEVNEPGRRIYGWPAPRATRAELAAALHPDDRAALTAEVESTFDPAGRRTFEAEHRILRPDGGVRWLRVRGRAVFAHAAGGPRAVRCVGTFLDVTDRKRTEEELREGDRKKDDFLALLAHELRNPLAPIRNGLQVIRLSDDRLVRQRSQEMMDRQLAHMVRLIDDLLDVSRIGRNKMSLRRERVLLADVLATAVETARPAIDAAEHELTLAIHREPVVLDADLTRLAQVFSNLLNNAAKYTERGGRIWLSAERVDHEVAVSVRDTGIGIPADALPTVFDMFSQVDRTSERTAGGLGIGLALVKGLAEMHGGRVAAESPGPGRGSTFTVHLPIPTDPPAAQARKGHAPTPAFGKRILVVDDNRDGARSMADMLSLLGSEVATAHDGLEAVAAAEAFRPDAILMDLGMPRLNGLDATRRIRAKAWGRAVPIIALTGWGQESDRAASREAGCDRHLVKPVSLADLQKLIAELTERA